MTSPAHVRRSVRTHRARWRVVSGGVTLAVREVGDPAWPAVVVAHGVGSSSRFVVAAFAAPLTAARLRLVAYDLRGHGRSDAVRDPAAHALEHQIADLVTVVDAVGARVVGGVSLGAHAAAALGAGRPGLDGVLVCLPGWTGRAAPGVGVRGAVAEAVRRDGVEALLARAVADPSTPGWLVRTLTRDWPTHDAASLAAALLALDGGRAPADPELGRVRCPAAVVGWPGDAAHPLAVARHWARTFARAELAVTSLQDVGEEPARLGAAAVEAWRRAAG